MPDDVGAIESAWRTFADAIMPPDASESQWREMRRAFLGGAAALNFYLKEIAEMSAIDANRALLDIDAELDAAFALIGEGKD